MNKKTISGVQILLFILIFNSCTDDPLQVGFELLPGSDLLATFADTLTVEGFTVKGFDGEAYNFYSANNNARNNSYYSSIGHCIDPIFGDSWAEATIAFTPIGSYKLEDSVISSTYKSCKIYLHIDEDGTYGGDAGFDIILHPLRNTISHKHLTNYKVKSEDFNIDLNLADATHHKVYKDLDISENDTGNYYLVVDMNKAYTLPLMDTNYINEHQLYKGDNFFLEEFPGFYIRTNAINETGGLEKFYFNLSYMVLEYDVELLTKTKDGKNDSIVIESRPLNFRINQYQSLYRHQSNFAPDGPFGTFLGDTAQPGSQVFVQSLGGAAGFLKFPKLKEWREHFADSIGINLAELVLPINTDYCDTTGFYLPPRISLLSRYKDKIYTDSINIFGSIIDDNYSINDKTPYHSGYLDLENMEYRVNITEYVHQVVHGGTYPNWVYIVASKQNLNTFSAIDHSAPGRAIFNTGNGINSAYLRVIYTNTNY